MNFKRIISTLAVVAVAGSLGAASWPEKKPIYMISTNEAAVLNPIATTGDVISGTVIRGIPDGMGAFLNDRGGLKSWLPTRYLLPTRLQPAACPTKIHGAFQSPR